MYRSHLKGFTILSCCLLLGACTETIIKEVTPSTTTDSASVTGAEETVDTAETLGDGSNMVPALDTVDPVTPETPTVTTTEDTASVQPPTSSLLLEDPSANTITGTPGTTVNCTGLLPCRWVSEDTQFALTVTSADNIASRDRLALSYSITTSHDTTLIVSTAGNATDNGNLVLRAEDQTLGEGNGGTPQGLLAGAQLQGTINFDQSATGDAINDWSISVLDSGVIRMATFSDIPLGSLTMAQADCNYMLPCIWTTPENDVAITLQSVGGISTNNRVSANFTIETSSNMTIAIDEGSSANGSDGTLFEGRTLGLGLMTDYKKLTASVVARSPYFGSVQFYRTATTPAYLTQLSLILYQDEPVPRWAPQFVNVPLD